MGVTRKIVLSVVYNQPVLSVVTGYCFKQSQEPRKKRAVWLTV